MRDTITAMSGHATQSEALRDSPLASGITNPGPDWVEPPGLLKPRAFATGLIAALLITIGVGLSGSGSVPPEPHDVLNAQTAYEMYHRGDWLIPYFNGIPRLNKPPLGYWLTAGVAWLTGANGDITVWHARVGSVLAAAMLIVATVILGRRLFGPSIGLLAGFFAATAHGVASMSHSGRPDMLYSALCAWQFAAFIEAYHAPDRSWSQRLWAWGSWVAFGLATLAKGPHVPAMFLGVAIVWLIAFRTPWGRALRVIRPVAGLPLAVLIALPWFIYIRGAMTSADLSSSVAGGDELSGSDLSVSWMNPLRKPWFYPLQLFRMMLPWVVFMPGAIAACLARGPVGRLARILAGAVVVMMVLFSFGRLQRTHYLVPTIAFAGLLLAVGVAHTGWRPKAKPGLGWVWPVLVIAHLVGAVALIAWVVYFDLHHGQPARWFLPVAGGLAAAALAVLFLVLRRRARKPLVFADHYGPFTLALIIAVAMGVSIGRRALWQGDRYPASEFALKVVQFRDEHTQIVAWRSTPALVTYYGRAAVPLYRAAAELHAVLTQAPHTTFAVVIDAADIDEMSRDVDVRTVLAEAVPKGETRHLLVVASIKVKEGTDQAPGQ